MGKERGEEMTDITSTEINIVRGGQEIEVCVDGYVEYVVDRNYGADADGNRAVKKVVVTDVKDVTSYYDGEEFGGEIKLTDSELKQAESALAEKFLEGV